MLSVSPFVAAPISADERAAAGRELKELAAENAALENEWLQLGEDIERIEQEAQP